MKRNRGAPPLAWMSRCRSPAWTPGVTGLAADQQQDRLGAGVVVPNVIRERGAGDLQGVGCHLGRCPGHGALLARLWGSLLGPPPGATATTIRNTLSPRL